MVSDDESEQPVRRIPGPAGKFQAAMEHKIRRIASDAAAGPSNFDADVRLDAQEYRQAMETEKYDDSFDKQPWLKAIEFMNGDGVSDFLFALALSDEERRMTAAPLPDGCSQSNSNSPGNVWITCPTIADIGKARSNKHQVHRYKGSVVFRVAKVFGVIDGLEKTWESDELVTYKMVLKDPTGKVGASLTGKGMTHDWRQKMKNGSALIIVGVTVWSPSSNRFYLNITMRNLVEIIP